MYLIKHKALDGDFKTIKQINFTGNLDQDGDTAIFLLFKKWKNPFQFFQRNL